MAENTIDNLSIQVTASADKAASVFDRLASSAGRLRGAAQGAAGGLHEVGEAANNFGNTTKKARKESEEVGKNIRSVGKAAKDAGDNAKKGASGLATFWQSLKRIAFYRFIRSIIKEITEAFKEGITNLYHWSAAVNGTFAKSMDRIATSTLYLKNSLGAMLAPLINTLAPVIEWIIDRIVDVINWINKLFAALSGSQTYTVAKKVATTWADAGKSAASSAKKSADDIKRTILGFDEINKLEKQNTSSGSGGSGSITSGPNYKDMFEERKLDGWMSKLASFIDKFNLQIPAVFGSLLAGWASVKLAIKGVAALSLGWLKDMAGKAINIAVSLFRKGWTTIKNWALSFGEAIVDMAVRIKTSVVELWAKLAAAWSALSPVLKVGIAVSVTAAALWGLYKLAWALVPDKMLQVEVAIKTAAVTLKNGLVKAWNNLAVWSLSVGVRIATTAAQLKNDIIRAWNKLTEWFLGVKLRIETKLADLWKWVKDNWKIVAAAALGVAIAIATPWSTIATALSSLWAEVMASFGGALAFSVVPTLNPTGDYGLGWTPNEFNSKQEEIDNAAKELRGSSTSTAMPKVDTSALTKGLLGAGGVAAIGALVSGLFSGGASTALGSIFMPGVNSAADKSELSPKTSYYNNMTGELVIPKSVEVGVNYVANGNKTYKNSTLGKYLTDIMAKVKPTAQTKVSSIAGALMKVIGNALTPVTSDTTTTNTVKASPGSAMKVIGNALSAIVGDTNTKNTVLGAAGAGMRALGNAFSAIVGDTMTTNTVKGAAGAGMVYTWDGYMPQTKDTFTTNTVKAAPGNGMVQTWDGIMPSVQDTTATANIDVNAPWLYFGRTLKSWLGMDNLDTTAWVDVQTPWWYWGKSPLQWLGLDNLKAVVDVVTNVSSTVANTINKISGKKKAAGGVFSGGRWSNIPQYAGGNYGVNHGSLFWAGENGAEIVGNAGGRTEVLNRSQIASAMYSAVQAAMAPAAANFASAAESIGSVRIGFDIETLAEMVRQGVEQAMSRSNDLDRQRNEYLRQINDKEFTTEVTSNDINNAQRRMNRRAGTTVVAVG